MNPDNQRPCSHTSDLCDGTSETEVLLTRIVDGEAATTERERFERLAAVEPSLWRRLALKHQDASMLLAHVEPTLNAAERIELPDLDLSSANRTSWWMAASGWAALITLAITWAVSNQMRGGDHPATNGIPADTRGINSLAPEEHLQQYLRAPFVLGEMQPTLLQVEPLPDGRYAMSYVRRIVEVSMFDSPEDVPASDEHGNLPSSPHASAQPRSTTQPAD